MNTTETKDAEYQVGTLVRLDLDVAEGVKRYKGDWRAHLNSHLRDAIESGKY